MISGIIVTTIYTSVDLTMKSNDQTAVMSNSEALTNSFIDDITFHRLCT